MIKELKEGWKKEKKEGMIKRRWKTITGIQIEGRMIKVRGHKKEQTNEEVK